MTGPGWNHRFQKYENLKMRHVSTDGQHRMHEDLPVSRTADARPEPPGSEPASDETGTYLDARGRGAIFEKDDFSADELVRTAQLM